MTATVEPTRAGTAYPAAFHTLTVAAVERLTDDAAAVTFDVPADLRRRVRLRGRAVAHPAPDDRRRRAPPHVLHLRAGRRSVPGSASARSRTGCSPRGWSARSRPGTEIEVQTPTGSFRADPATGGPAPVHRRRLRDHPDAVDRQHRAGEPRRRGDAALRQPHQRLGDVRRGARRPQEPLRPALPARARAQPRAPRRRAVLRPPRRRPAAPAAGRVRRRCRRSTTCGCAARSR